MIAKERPIPEIDMLGQRLRERGFTLTEMLIVLLVLGVLLSISGYLAGPLLERTVALSDDAELEQVQKGMWAYMTTAQVERVPTATSVTDFALALPQLYPGVLGRRYPGSGRAYSWDEFGNVSLGSAQVVGSRGWLAAYYANRHLSGAPVTQRWDASISFDWGTDAPDPLLPQDGFSVRWTQTLAFESGLYRFYLSADDGARLLLDGKTVLDAWESQDAASTDRTVTMDIAAGDHELVVEYYDALGPALVSLSWDYLGQQQGTFRGEYWNNRNLGGPAVASDTAAVLDFDWGRGAPAPGVLKKNWSTRWSGLVEIRESGTYRFATYSDSGVRLLIDGTPVIDQWTTYSKPARTYHDVPLLFGEHSLVLEYFHRRGRALLSLNWSMVAEERPGWQGEYYGNPDLQGAPFFTRTDEVLEFDWGKGSPGGGLPRDRFSARWQRTLHFTEGEWRFRVRANDGVRLYVDDRLVLDRWRKAKTNRKVNLNLEAGDHPIVLEYRENKGRAYVSLTWQRR